MKALILAAGQGTRVMPLTRQCPKPMLRILDTPVLELLIARLRDHGVTQILINTAHHANVIEQYFGDGRRFGVDIAYAFEGYLGDGGLIGQPIGSAGALRAIHAHSGFFDDSFFVLCGDAVVDLDFTALLAAHHAHGAIATLALKQVPQDAVHHYGVAVLDESGRITQFQEKPSAETALSDLANTGIYVFEPEILHHVPDTQPWDLGSQVFPALADAGLPIYGVALPMRWLDIGRREDYFQVNMLALQGDVPGLRLSGREVVPGILCGLNVRVEPRRCRLSGPVVIGGSATIEDGATIVGPCYIGAGAVIERGAEVQHSIVLGHARVGGHARLNRMVSDGHYCIAEDGTVIDLVRADLPWLVADARVPRVQLAAAEQRFVDGLV